MMLKKVLPVSGEWFVMLVDSEDPESYHSQRIAAWGVFDGSLGETTVLPLIPKPDGIELGVPDDDVLGIADADESRASFWRDKAIERHREAIEQERTELSDELAARTASELTNDEIVLLKALKNREAFVSVREHLNHLWGKDLIEKVRGGHRITSFGERVLAKLTR